MAELERPKVKKKTKSKQRNKEVKLCFCSHVFAGMLTNGFSSLFCSPTGIIQMVTRMKKLFLQSLKFLPRQQFCKIYQPRKWKLLRM